MASDQEQRRVWGEAACLAALLGEGAGWSAAWAWGVGQGVGFSYEADSAPGEAAPRGVREGWWETLSQRAGASISRVELGDVDHHTWLLARLDTTTLPDAPTRRADDLMAPFQHGEVPDECTRWHRAGHALVRASQQPGHVTLRWCPDATVVEVSAALMEEAVARDGGGLWRVSPAPRPPAEVVMEALGQTARRMLAPAGGMEQLEAWADELEAWYDAPGLGGELGFAMSVARMEEVDGAMGRALLHRLVMEVSAEVPALRRAQTAVSLARTADAWRTLARFSRACALSLAGVLPADQEPHRHIASLARAVVLFEDTFWERCDQLF